MQSKMLIYKQKNLRMSLLCHLKTKSIKVEKNKFKCMDIFNILLICFLYNNFKRNIYHQDTLQGIIY